MKSARILAVVALFCLTASPVLADWLTLPSRYTHDDRSGQRVSQYAPVELPAVPNAPPLRTSGYTHYRSTLAYGQSADNYHRVEEWGDPVRPYGEWRFPFRPYSTPYPNWGQPFGGLNLYNGFAPGVGIGPGLGFGPGAGFRPGTGGGIGFQPGFGNPVGPGVNLPANPPNRPNSGNPAGQPRQPYRRPNPAAGTNSFAPYPSGRGTPYPVAPYYDGYYPNYRD